MPVAASPYIKSLHSHPENLIAYETNIYKTIVEDNLKQKLDPVIFLQRYGYDAKTRLDLEARLTELDHQQLEKSNANPLYAKCRAVVEEQMNSVVRLHFKEKFQAPDLIIKTPTSVQKLQKSQEKLNEATSVEKLSSRRGSIRSHKPSDALERTVSWDQPLSLSTPIPPSVLPLPPTGSAKKPPRFGIALPGLATGFASALRRSSSQQSTHRDSPVMITARSSQDTPSPTPSSPIDSPNKFRKVISNIKDLKVRSLFAKKAPMFPSGPIPPVPAKAGEEVERVAEIAKATKTEVDEEADSEEDEYDESEEEEDESEEEESEEEGEDEEEEEEEDEETESEQVAKETKEDDVSEWSESSSVDANNKITTVTTTSVIKNLPTISSLPAKATTTTTTTTQINITNMDFSKPESKSSTSAVVGKDEESLLDMSDISELTEDDILNNSTLVKTNSFSKTALKEGKVVKDEESEMNFSALSSLSSLSEDKLVSRR